MRAFVLVGLSVVATCPGEASIPECTGDACLPGIPFADPFAEAIFGLSEFSWVTNEVRNLFLAVQAAATDDDRKDAIENFYNELQDIEVVSPWGTQYAANPPDTGPTEGARWTPLRSETVDMCLGGEFYDFENDALHRFRISGLRFAGVLQIAHGNRYYEVHDYEYELSEPNPSKFPPDKSSSTMSVLWFQTASDACEFTAYAAQTLGVQLTVCETSQSSVTGPPRKLYRGAETCGRMDVHWLRKETAVDQKVKYAISAGKCPEAPTACTDDLRCTESWFTFYPEKEVANKDSQCTGFGQGFFDFQSTADCERALGSEFFGNVDRNNYVLSWFKAPYQIRFGYRLGDEDGTICQNNGIKDNLWVPFQRDDTWADLPTDKKYACRCNRCSDGATPEQVKELTCSPESKKQLSGAVVGGLVAGIVLVLLVGAGCYTRHRKPAPELLLF